MIKLLLRILLGGVCLSSGLLPAWAATVHVSIIGVSFNPKVVTVNVGDTVVWTNGQNVHTVSPNLGVSEPFCGGSSVFSCSHTFTNTGSFAYHCNFHENSHSMTGQVIVVVAPVGVPPLVTITNLPDNALFAAPAMVSAGVAVSDSDGSVVSVEWLTNGVSTALVTNAPFSLSLSNLGQGDYILRARALDDQSLGATSAPVRLRVVIPPVLIFEPGTNCPMLFSFNTVSGVNYVVESAVDVTEFSPLATNAGSGTVQQFMAPIAAPAQRFFRLRLE